MVAGAAVLALGQDLVVQMPRGDFAGCRMPGVVDTDAAVDGWGFAVGEGKEAALDVH